MDGRFAEVDVEPKVLKVVVLRSKPINNEFSRLVKNVVLYVTIPTCARLS